LPTASPSALPTGDYAFAALLLIFATGCVATGFRLLYERQFIFGLSAIVVSILFFFAELKWPSSYLVSGSLISAAIIIIILTTVGNWSEITRRAANPRYRSFALAFVLLSFGIYIITYMNALRSDIDTYVMPRSVTQKQADDLHENLSHHDKYAVTVKVNPLDAEAREYGAQLLNALNRSDWTATFDTSGNDPNIAPSTLNDGLCIDVIGENTKPYDAKHDPKPLLETAFSAAGIIANCGGGTAAGNYKLFVVVGHRPLAYGYKPPLLVRLGQWISSLSR
jgi:hypothetical protein